MHKHQFCIAVTERCNLRCRHCYWHEPDLRPDPCLDDLDRVLAQFKALGNAFGEQGEHLLAIGGGEPTLRNDLEDLVTLAKQRGFSVRLTTNAVRMSRRRAESLRDSGLEAVQVSIDGASEDAHDRVRGRGNWTRAVRGAQALRDAGAFIILNCVLRPGGNMETAHLMLDLACNLDVAGVKFARLVPAGQVVTNGLQTNGDFGEAYTRILAHARQSEYARYLLFLDPAVEVLRRREPHHFAGLPRVVTDLCKCRHTLMVEVDAVSGNIHYCRDRTVLGNIWENDLVAVWMDHPLLRRTRQRKAGPADTCPACLGASRSHGGRRAHDRAKSIPA